MGSERRDLTIQQKILEIVPEAKQKYVLWKLGLIEDDWLTLSKRYLNGQSLYTVEAKYKTDTDVQKAMRLGMKILHNSKMIELYNIYFDKAKDDVQSFKAFVEFSDKFFADESESELISLLNGVDIDE